MTETIGAYRDAGVDEFVVPDFHLDHEPERGEFYHRFLEEVAAPLRDEGGGTGRVDGETGHCPPAQG
ncbi:MAG: hypothetical protein M3N32_06420 [Actinomycetota bacterium]|nr:hypothetical protein [Actinomycetota bacterium]